MGSWSKNAVWLTATVLPCLSIVNLTSAAPTHYENGFPVNASFPVTNNGRASAFTTRDTSIPLRILPVGASIMSGWGSNNLQKTGPGLRKPLRDALRSDGYDVNYVGSLTCTASSTTFADDDCEAVAGDKLVQVLARIPHSTGYKPNVVIINAGTNDAVLVAANDASVYTAGSRMNDVLNALWTAEDMSDTCVILSTLIPNSSPAGLVNTPLINVQFRTLVTQLAAEGKCIYLAEMWPNGDSDQWFSFDTDYLTYEVPHTHPNDKGHSMMAAVFYNTINLAVNDNKIVTPGVVVDAPEVCDKFAGNGIDAGGLTQRGSGNDDGIYYHSSIEMDTIEFTSNGAVTGLISSGDIPQWKFARLFNRNYDDFLQWQTSTSYAVWQNSADGKGEFTQISFLTVDLVCAEPAGVNFIDMNGDGLDDLVYIDEDGNAYLAINQGDGSRAAGKPPSFVRVSDTAKIMDTNGYTRDFVVLADIDGDGRGDYGRVDYDGNVQFWRNGGTGDAPSYWQALGTTWPTQNYVETDTEGTYAGTRFEDINGDGRDDMVWLDWVGAGHLWTNSRSCGKGLEGDGLHVAWREGYLSGTTNTKAYAGMGGYVTDTNKLLRDHIHFARIYGEENIFGNLPRQDYVFMEHFTLNVLGTTNHYFNVHVWKNDGGGATKLKGDGNKYCNMMGHSNGMVDYVWTQSTGAMQLWANRGKGTISDSDADGYWEYQTVVWTPTSNMNRKYLHLADWDGDGDCDIIYAAPDAGVEVWINNYPTTGTWDSWSRESWSALTCEETPGLGIFDLSVRFADISGNGMADHLCISPDSSVHGHIRVNDDGFTDYLQIKVSLDKDRANLRWADVNGDGLDDMLWIEKFSGDTYVWYNDGPKDPDVTAGSYYGWRVQDAVAYAGQVAGSCEYFADLNGDGFADEHYLSLGTFTNEARTSLSPGCGALRDNTGDDSDMTSDLPLPTVPGSSSGGGSGFPSTGTGCIAGSGAGDYAAICKFTCAIGYCPSPCSCTSTGTYDAGEEDTSIDGYANTGYDEATWTSLCNFACSHNFCPKTQCLWDEIIDPNVSGSIDALPTLEEYLENADAAAGEFFRYQVPEDPNTSISILYNGDKIDFPDGTTCNDITTGDNGAFVGCVGDTAEWLFLSISQDSTAMTIERRDTHKSTHTFTPLPHFTPDEYCSVHCRLQARAVLNSWVPVGEGTMQGRNHSLHFMNTGKNVAFKAIPGSLDTANPLARRVDRTTIGAVAIFGGLGYEADYLFRDPQKYTVNHKTLTHGMMDAALDRISKTCAYVVSNASTDATDQFDTEVALMFAPGTSLALDTASIDGMSDGCKDEIPKKRRYITWPRDGNDAATLRTQLFVLDPNTDEHISVNDYGTMYFVSSLTMLDAAKVTINKQCWEIEVHCTENHCPDPRLWQDDTDTSYNKALQSMSTQGKINVTKDDLGSKIQGRDGSWTEQTIASAELAWISKPDAATTRSAYKYDSTGATRPVRVYLLDPDWIDTSLSDFSVADSNGKTIKDKMAGNYISVGADGWTASTREDGSTHVNGITDHDHGTAMLMALAGGVRGIARESMLFGVTWDMNTGPQWVIDCLDKIQANWVATTTDLATFAVLSMSFELFTLGTAMQSDFARRLKILEALGVLSVAAAGNDGEPVTFPPAKFGSSLSANNPANIMVLGAVSTSGLVWTSSNTASYIELYAPGVGVEARYWKGTGTDRVEAGYAKSGTSFSTAYTAGLAAYLLGLPDTTKNILNVAQLKAKIMDLAWARSGVLDVNGNPVLGIYNGAPA